MPTATIGDNTTDTYANSDSVRMGEGVPTSNQNADVNLELTTYSTTDRSFSLIKFPGISSLPSGATITAASIFLYKTNDNQLQEANGQTVSPTVQAKRLLRNWDETQATWNVWTTGNNWTTAGAGSDGNDRSATVSGSASLPVGSGQNAYHEIPLNSTGIADVQAFLDGTLSNYGWRLGLADESGTGNSTGQYQVFNQEGAGAASGTRPYLSVTYTEAGGGQPITRRLGGIPGMILTGRRSW